MVSHTVVEPLEFFLLSSSIYEVAVTYARHTLMSSSTDKMATEDDFSADLFG